MNQSSSTAPRAHRRAVVLGGGLTGALVAAVLAEHADEVTIIDRDLLPPVPAPRKGLPQARHAHLLWSGGASIIESLLPGTHDRWLAAGARRIPLPTGLVTLTAEGWMRRWPEMQFLIACSRDLLDWVIREQVFTHPNITVREATEVIALAGNAQRVTGVHLRDAAMGTTSRLDVDLVVDATGRGSAAPRWLTALGLPTVREGVVDSGLAYATRLFRAPEGTEDYPVVNVQSDPREPIPGQTATLVPIENRQWLVTLSGTRGGHPPKEAAEFEAFARQVRHPVVAEIIADAEPLTDVYVSRSTINRRRFFERLTPWPAGFLVIGDAVATYNPVYGQGMSVAAGCAATLRDALRQRELGDPQLSRHVQRRVGRIAEGPWSLATGQDILYPGAIGNQPPFMTRLLRGYTDRLLRTATGRPTVAQALFDAMTLSRPLTCLVTPSVVAGVLRGPGQPPLAEPPLTVSENRFHQRSAPPTMHQSPGGEPTTPK
ncbi:FAD-dependent oxidoreductase [Streptomyces sioyaensis]|uniref:FAD-dependent oxidoreductase n=1 Tax=Streptomyces sioyaensis TaxID=67364 RepID=UPI0037BD3E6A